MLSNTLWFPIKWNVDKTEEKNTCVSEFFPTDLKFLKPAQQHTCLFLAQDPDGTFFFLYQL